MDERTFNSLFVGLLTDGQHIDGSSGPRRCHTEHYRYKGDIYTVDYNSLNEPFAIFSTTSNHTFRHPKRSDQ